MTFLLDCNVYVCYYYVYTFSMGALSMLMVPDCRCEERVIFSGIYKQYMVTSTHVLSCRFLAYFKYIWHTLGIFLRNISQGAPRAP